MQLKLILIAVSTGGPVALRQLFSGLPRLDAGIVLVQHMPKYINRRVCQKLATLTEMDVVLAENNARIEHGRVYVAPSEVHLELMNNRLIRLLEGPKVCYVRPAADVAMKSVQASQDLLPAAVVLTGMGADGAQGLQHIKRIGGATFAQDQASSAIYGMPERAQATGAVDVVANPDTIRDHLIKLTGVQRTAVGVRKRAGLRAVAGANAG